METTKVRKLFGLSKTEMGEMLGMSRDDWSSIEEGRQDLPEHSKQMVDNILFHIELRECNEQRQAMEEGIQIRITSQLSNMMVHNEYRLCMTLQRIERAKRTIESVARRNITRYASNPRTGNKAIAKKILESVADRFSMSDDNLQFLESQIYLLQRKKKFFESEIKKMASAVAYKEKFKKI